MSPYVYCNNNPLIYIDPTGMAYEISEEEWMKRAETNNWVEDTQEEIQRQIDDGTYSYGYLNRVAIEAAKGNNTFVDRFKNLAGNILEFAAQKNDIPADFLKAVAWTESNWQHFDSEGSVLTNSYSGDYGFMQINATTWFGIYDAEKMTGSVFDNIMAGADIARDAYNRAGKKYSSHGRAFSAYSIYNGGPRAIHRADLTKERHINDIHFRSKYMFEKWKK